MSANFSVQFRINEKTQTRVIRLTDTSSGFTLAKGNFSVTFPDGSTRIKTDWISPDITSPAAYIDILAVTDINDDVITGSYKIDFIALDATTTSYSASKTFDFNWIKPTNSITDLSDVLIPQVQFKDNASYSPIGSFTGTLTRVFSTPFPTTSEASAQPATTTSTNTLTPVYTGNYYEGVYNISNDITCTYTHTTNSWLTINYIELFTKTVTIKKCPTQIELIGKINTYRAVIEAYKEKNDTQFNILSEQYDLAIALYSHIIARYETGTQDGSEGQLRELLSILEPYTGSYTYQSTKMLQFELASSGANSFNITDGTNTDSVTLGSSVLFSSGNAALVPSISNNQVTYTPIFGTTSNTFAQGNDSRLHNAVTLGTPNGLSLASQVLSLALATSSTSGALSAADKAKLDGIAAGANVGTVTSVALAAPSAFTVTNSPVTSSGTIVLSANGNPSQYIDGSGALQTFPTSLPTTSMQTIGRNSTGSTLYKGTVVYISGSTGNRPNFVKAQANAESTSAGTFGVVFADIANNTDGYVVTIGTIDTLDTRSIATNPFTTDTLADGDTIYLSPTTAGYVTNVKPSAPNHLVYIGKVVRTSPTNGTIVYRIQNGYELDEIHDVQVGSYVNKDILYRDTATNLWKNASIATVLGYTPLQSNQTITLSGAVTGSGTTAITTTLANSVVGVANLSATGTPSSTTYLRGDNTWATITAGSSGTVTSVDALTLGTTGTDLSSTVANGTTTPVITLNVPTASATNRGALSAADWSTFNAKQSAITLTTTGSSGASTLVGATLNIPTYTLAGLGGQASSTNLTSLSGLTYVSSSFVKMTAAGTFSLDTNTYYLASNPNGYTNNTGTVTSVAALTIGTAGTDLTSTVATGTTTPVITLNVPTASATNRGALSSSDWTTFNNKQATITLTTTGSSGAATFSSNTLNVPNYTLAGLGGQASSTNLTSLSGLSYVSASFVKMTAAGTFTLDTNTYYLASNPNGYTNNTGTVTSVAALTLGTTGTDLSSTVATGTTTPVITLNVPSASATNRGVLTSADWTTFNSKQGTITLTTTGSSGAATFSSNTLNIPTYTLAGLGGQASSTNLTSLSGLTYVSASFVKMTAAGTFALDTNTYYLASNPSGYTNNTGTVTSVAALTLGTTGTDLSSSVATGTTTPVITLNVPTASATNRGALSAADWSTFNGKQAAITLTTTGSSGAATFATNTLNIPNYTLAGLGGVPTSRTLTINGTALDLSADRSWTISGSDATKLPLAGGTMTGQIVSSFAEAIKLTQGSGYIAGYNAAGTTRQGYIQWTNGNAYFAAEASSNLVLMTQGSNRVSINTAGDLSVLYGSYFSGTINTYATQAIKMNANSCYIGGFDTAGTTRYGYLQFASGSLNLASEAGAGLNLISNSTTRIYVTPAGNTGMGTTSPLSMLHLYGGTLTVNSSGTSEIGGGMRIISHTKRTVGATKFIKIYAGINNYFTGFIYGMNFDDYPVGSATSTGSGSSYQFGGYSDGSGAHADKYMDLLHFGGNNVGSFGREMNTDGNGYIITATTSTGAGGFKASATIMLFARDMSQVVISYY